jgi:zinc protease
MRHLRLALSLALLSSGCGTVRLPFHHSEEALASLKVPPPPIERTYEVLRLPSGLRMVTHRVAGQRDVTVRLAVQAGPVYEPAGKPGTAVVARLAVWLARTGPGGARLEESLFAAGALYDDTMSLDETAWEVRCRPAQLPVVLAALARLLDDPAAAVEAADVAEVQARLEGDRERIQAEPAVHLAAIEALALAGTSYQRPPPSPEAIQAVTLDDVRAYLRATFTPRRAVLTATTGLPPRDANQAMAAALPGRLVGDPAAAVAPEPPPGQAPLAPFEPGATEVLELAGAERAIWLAWPIPGARAEAEVLGYAAAWALQNALAQGLSASRPPGIGQPTVTYEAWDGAGVLVARLGLSRRADGELVRARLLAAAAGIRRWSGPPGWVTGVVKQAAFLDASVGRQGNVARALRAAGAPDALARLEAQATSLAGAWPAFRDRWLAPGPSVVVEVRAPSGAAEGLGAAGRVAEGAAEPGRWPVAKEPLATAAPGRAEVARLLEPPGLDRARRERLPNGAEVVVLPRPGAPYVWANLMLPSGGGALSDVPVALESLALARAYLRHRSDCTDAAVPSAFTGAARLSGVAPSHRTTWLLETLGCWERAWPGAASQAGDDPPRAWRIAATLDALATGAPLPAAGARPRPMDGPAYLERALHPEGATLIVVGDLAAVEPVAAAARQALAAWPARQPEASPAPAPWPAARRAALLDFPGARNAAADILLRLPAVAGGSLAAELVATRLLLRRLERTLAPSRLEVSAFQTRIGGARYLYLSVDGAPALIPPALGEALAQAQALADGEAPAVEVDLARWGVARSLAYELDTGPEALEGLAFLAWRGLPADTWERFPAELAAVGPAEVRAALQSMGVGRESILVMGARATIDPALEKLGLAWEPGPPPEQPE